MPLELDNAQREAVESPERAVMVVAGPGTGKTRVLSSRVRWLTEYQGVDPSKILAITYTNRAAAEMRSRLLPRKLETVKASAPESGKSDLENPISPASEVTVATFHAWAYRLVRKYHRALGFNREPVIFDDDAKEQVLRKILAERRIPEEAAPVRHLKQHLDRVKSEVACPLMDIRYDPEHFETLMDIFRSYQQELDLRGVLDFSDILLTALRLLYLHPDIREEITGSIEHLLIDEFQDINSAQYRIVDALEHPGLSLFAVGDEDQTIYAFRGSSGVFIDRFVADFGAALIPLGSSYRCDAGILYAAGSLISNNGRFYQRAPNPPDDLREKPPIGVFEVEDEEEEAKIASKLIKSWINAGCEYREIAILYRVHYIADACESILIDSGIPTLRLLPERQKNLIPGDPLPLLKLAVIDTEWDWDRALGLPRDRLGELDDLRIRLAARKDDAPLYRLLNQPSKFKHMSALARSQLAGLNKFVRKLRNRADKDAPSELLNLAVKHLDENRSPWNKAEDEWLANEISIMQGFEKISPGVILDEWHASDDGIRIFHGPTITAYLAAKILMDLCEEILGIEAERIPVPFDRAEIGSSYIDSRPGVIIGLNSSPDIFYPPETLLPRATYITGEGVSDHQPENPVMEENVLLVLASLNFSSKLAGYRPGGGEDEILVFFDLETTGTDIFRSEIVEIAAVKVHLKGDDIRELGHFHSLIRPNKPVPASAQAIHGISDDDVRDAPHATEIIPGFLDFIGDAPLAGHNIDSFDLPILKRYAGELLNRVVQNLTLDTLPLSRRLFPDEPHRLTVLAEKFGIDTGTAHRALDDVRTNIEVFRKLTEIDESFRARGFLSDLPLILALAHAVDDNRESDPVFINQAAIRRFTAYDGEIEKHPFIETIKDDLTPGGLKNIIGILKTLARSIILETPGNPLLTGRIEMLREEALRLEDEHPEIMLGEYLGHIALLTDGDFESDEDAVRMMTLHAAKGLEFDRVIIIGMEQGNLPHRLAMNKTVLEIEEERRLLYVGLTRARKRAALVYARRRNGRWRGQSMFLHELPRRSYKRFRTKDRISGK